MLITSALMCLYLNTYFEAKGEPIEGQKLVAATLWTRSGKDENEVCEELRKKNQFSWVKDKTIQGKKGWKLRKEFVPDFSSRAWAQAVLSSREAMRKSPAVYYFHRKGLSLVWTKELRVAKVVGNHVFYWRENGRSKAAKREGV